MTEIDPNGELARQAIEARDAVENLQIAIAYEMASLSTTDLTSPEGRALNNVAAAFKYLDNAIGIITTINAKDAV